MKTFSIAVAMLASLVAAGDFSKSCTDEHIDPATQVLTANCNAGDGKGTVKSTSLDLNQCFTYTGTKIQVCELSIQPHVLSVADSLGVVQRQGPLG